MPTAYTSLMSNSKRNTMSELHSKIEHCSCLMLTSIQRKEKPISCPPCRVVRKNKKCKIHEWAFKRKKKKKPHKSKVNASGYFELLEGW